MVCPAAAAPARPLWPDRLPFRDDLKRAAALFGES
jgi:hypothetical protein